MSILLFSYYIDRYFPYQRGSGGGRGSLRAYGHISITFICFSRRVLLEILSNIIGKISHLITFMVVFRIFFIKFSDARYDKR